MSIDRSRVRVGMQVVAADGLPVGQVSDLDPSNFIVERPDLPTVAVPYSHIAGISGDELRLNEFASEVDKQGYIVPERSSRPLGQERIARGTEVLGSDGDRIGEVVDTQEDSITVDAPLRAQRYYIPSSAVTNVTPDRVVVAVPAGDIDAMGWNVPPAGGLEQTFTLSPKMDVVGSDGDRVGAVDEVHAHYFSVKRSLAPDFFIPYSAVQQVRGDTVVLNVPDEQVHEFGWESPPAQRPARVPGQPQVRQGMEVVGTEGDHVGTVTSVDQDSFAVDRRMQADLHVPYGYVRDITVDRVVLTVPQPDVAFMNWEVPAPGTEHDQPQP